MPAVYLFLDKKKTSTAVSGLLWMSRKYTSSVYKDRHNQAAHDILLHLIWLRLLPGFYIYLKP